jgi:hypothetical protein
LNSSDGTHPSATGRAKVADSLLAFVRRDAATAPWYATGLVSVPHPGSAASGIALAVSPNPSSGTVHFTVTAPPGVHWRLTVVDAAGRRVFEDTGIGIGSAVIRSPANIMGITNRAGAYFVRLDAGGAYTVHRLILLAPPTGHR